MTEELPNNLSTQAYCNSVEAWKSLKQGFTELYMVPEIHSCVSEDHYSKTPSRTANGIFELFSGCFTNPEEILKEALFDSKCDELVYVNDISFVSICAHHTLPFLGRAHFAYLPDKHIVGISKIPRLVDTLARRPQIQEELSQQIVDTFMKVVQPGGCGVVIEAWHLCMLIRGAEEKRAYAKTTALRGAFKDNESLKREFLDGIHKITNQIWP